MSVLRRITGMGVAASLALALLAGGCVLAATVGPREAQATGLLGVQHMMNGLPQVEKTIVVTTNYQSVNSALQGVFQQVSLTRPTSTTSPASCIATSAAAPSPWPRGRRTGRP